MFGSMFTKVGKITKKREFIKSQRVCMFFFQLPFFFSFLKNDLSAQELNQIKSDLQEGMSRASREPPYAFACAYALAQLCLCEDSKKNQKIEAYGYFLYCEETKIGETVSEVFYFPEILKFVKP